MAHDASGTWSGFNYQGKVGLFHSLKLMNEKLQSDIGFDFSSYELVYENHEDFDIKVDGEIKSIHQVKAYNSSDPSKYKNAILEMILEIHTNNFNVTDCFLHTWKAVSFSTANIQEEFNLLKSEWQDDGSRQGSIIEKAVNRNREKIHKLSKIIRNKYDSSTAEEVVQSIDSLLVGDNSAISRFKIYEYSQGVHCCELETINGKITSQIESYLQLKKLPCDEIIIERSFASLLGNLDKHIIQRHLTISTPDSIPISFQELIQIIEDEYIGDASSAVLAYEFKQVLCESLYSFIQDEELFEDVEHGKYFSDTEHTYLESCIEKMFSLSAEELLDCYIKLSPQLDIKQNKRTTYNALRIEPSGIQNALFYIFSRLNSELLDSKDNRLFYNKSGKYYLPTSIALGTKSDLARRILSNPNFIVNTFEISTFIGGKNCPVIDDFLDTLGSARNVNLQEFLDGECFIQRERITQINNDLRLAPIQNIIGEIND